MAVVIGAAAELESGLPWEFTTVGILFLSLFAKMPSGVAAMALYYGEDCDSAITEPQCSDCVERENGRVRGVFFVKKSYEWTDRTDDQEWLDAIASGDVLIIPYTHGSFDGGTPNEGQGYGDQEVSYLNTQYVTDFFDPVLEGNRGFYNEIKSSRAYEYGFRTENLIWFIGGTATVLPKAPVEDDLNTEVVWNSQVKSTSADEPEFINAPEVIENVFVCLEEA